MQPSAIRESGASAGVATLACAALDVQLGGRPVLRQIGLSVGPGELVAVIGPNGSGKSTLLRTLAGLIRPSAGTVELGGARVEGFRRRELARRLAYLPQETWTEFGVTVEQLVLLGRYPHVGMLRPLGAEDRQMAAEAMRRADVDALAGRPLTTLSGGERRRAFIARAMAQGADMLVLDEPTSALDVGHACAVIDFLASLAREGRGVLFSLHDLSLALRGPHRAILLDAGQIAAEGSPEEVVGGVAAARAFGVPLAVVDDPPGVIPRA
jgi:iron complex transport system ATP-binding protein